MSVTLAPQITAAPQETRTPIFPREARCGLDEFVPKPHTIADTISARTLRIKPMVITAPTMVRSWLIPGRPLVLGSMLMSIGTSNGADMTLASRSNTVGLLGDGRPAHELADGVHATGAPAKPRSAGQRRPQPAKLSYGLLITPASSTLYGATKSALCRLL